MEVFASRESASDYVAAAIAKSLQNKLVSSDRATLALSGGSSPVDTYRRLSARELEWEKVAVTLTDERQVPATHQESNERMIRETLMKGPGEHASFVQLEEGALKPLLPFTACLVGMGEDGHFASIFPDSPQLQEALGSSKDVISITTPFSPFARVSMTLGTLIQSETLLLLAFGEKKREILENPGGYPVAHLLHQGIVQIVWAP